MVKNCEWCGKTFKTDNGNVRYCSEDCRFHKTSEKKKLKKPPKKKALKDVVSKANYDKRLEKEAADKYESIISRVTNYQAKKQPDYKRQQFLEMVEQFNLDN